MTAPECPSRRAVSAPVATSHSRIVCQRSPRRAARPAAGTERGHGRNAPRGGRSRPRPLRPTAGSCCPQEPEASRPSGSRQRASTEPACPSRRAVSAPVATSHSRIVLSREPEASRPSGSRQRALTSPECPARRAVSAPAATSHSRIVLSAEPEASRPSGSRHRALTQPACPSRRAVSAPAAASHSRIVLSSEPEASRPSGSRQGRRLGRHAPRGARSRPRRR